MGKDILDELFYGQIDPWEDEPEDIETFRRLNHEMAEIWNDIERIADSEVLTLLESYVVRRSDMAMLLQLERFKAGFRLGAQLYMAAVGNEKPPE